MKKIVLVSACLLFAFSLYGQDYKQLVAEGSHRVESIVEVAEQYFDTVGRERGTGYKPFRRWKYFAERTMDETGKLKSPEFYYTELENYNASINNVGFASRTVVGTWEEMGPTYWNATSGYNPGVGRITSIAIDKSNQNHIIAGSETGGVWQSLNGGMTWTVLTDNLANIDVYSLSIDPLISSTYFWGSHGGSIFKSIDSGATWTLHGSLPGGRVNKILIHPTDTSKMYASSQGAGLYKSVNGGATWTIISSGATNGYDFEFKPGDPNTVYASGSNFYKSIDGGVIFSAANNSGTNTDGLDGWIQEFIDGTTKWKRSNSNQDNSVTPRTGDGMVWFHVNDFSMPVTQLVTPSLDLSASVDPQVKFAYTNVNWDGNVDQLRVLYKTSLGGAWEELANYVVEASSWEDITINLPNPSSDYYIAFEGTSNYARGITLDDISVETSNIGILFSEGFEFTPGNMSSGPKMIGVSDADPSIVYVIESSSGIFGSFYKSADSGSTFTEIDHYSKNYFGFNSNGDDSLGQAPRDMDIAINPNDIDDVHIAGINTWRSTNGGVDFSISSQWTPEGASSQNIGYCHADVDLLEFAGTGANTKLFVCSDGGVFRADKPTIVNEAYYTDLTSGMGIRQFYKIGVSQTNPVVITGGSQDNGSSILGSDGNWTDWLGADGMEGFVDKNDSQIIYGTSQFGSFFKSINGGVDVIDVTQPDDKGGQYIWNWIVPFEQDPIVQDVIYCAFDEVYKSVDGGVNWTSISQSFVSSIDHLKLAPTNNNNLYLAIDGDFWYTTNGGALWTQSTLDIGGGWINSIAVHPTDPSKIAIATTNSQKVYVSEDNGVSWTPILWDLPDFSAQTVTWQNNGDDGLYVGMNYGVYYTDSDLGNTWTLFNNGLPNVRINELEINAADSKLYAATYGRGLWRSDLYTETLSVGDFAFNDLSLYPNPAKSEVNIKWNKSEDVSIRVYNTLGKLMFYGKKVNLLNGLKIDVSSYKSGVYFVKLNSIKGEITKKLILK